MTLVDGDLPSNFWQCVGGMSMLFRIVKCNPIILVSSSLFHSSNGWAGPPRCQLLWCHRSCCHRFPLCVQKVYLRTSRQLRLLDVQASAPMYTQLLETLDGLLTIRAFAWQSATTDEALRLLDEAQKPHYLLFCIQRWLNLVMDLFVAACGIILVAFAVALPESTSPGSVALALVSLIGLSQLLTHVILTWTTLETSLGAISRLKTFERETPQETSAQHSEEVSVTWPSSGRLQMQQVTASYSTKPGAPALNNISLEIQHGSKVAICGRTGSGKSSLLSTLFRLLELDSGSITIDGLDIRHVPLDVLRRRLIAVPQEATVFPGSLRSNLVSKTAGESSLQQSDDQPSSLRSRESGYGSRFPWRGGLDTDTADLALSHGQKQLLCLASAIVRKDSSPILILDEAMSDVDEQTEELMTKLIETEFEHHTVISVVHKLHSVCTFDKIVVLDHGHVAETGTWTELLGMENGKFRDLIESLNR